MSLSIKNNKTGDVDNLGTLQIIASLLILLMLLSMTRKNRLSVILKNSNDCIRKRTLLTPNRSGMTSTRC